MPSWGPASARLLFSSRWPRNRNSNHNNSCSQKSTRHKPPGARIDRIARAAPVQSRLHQLLLRFHLGIFLTLARVWSRRDPGRQTCSCLRSTANVCCLVSSHFDDKLQPLKLNHARLSPWNRVYFPRPVQLLFLLIPFTALTSNSSFSCR